MSAQCPEYPRQADLRTPSPHVADGPQPDPSRCSNQAWMRGLLDHLVGAAQQRERNGDAERLGGLEVDDQLDLSGLLNRQLGRLLAFEDAASVEARLTIQVDKVGTVAHQPAGRCKSVELKDR